MNPTIMSALYILMFIFSSLFVWYYAAE